MSLNLRVVKHDATEGLATIGSGLAGLATDNSDLASIFRQDNPIRGDALGIAWHVLGVDRHRSDVTQTA